MIMHKYISFFTALLLSICSLLYGCFDKCIVFFLLVYCWREGKRDGHWYSPYYLLCVSLASYIFYVPSIIPGYLTVLSVKTKILVVSCFCMLIIGFVVARRSGIKSIIEKEGNATSFWPLFIIGVIPTVVSYMQSGLSLNAESRAFVEAKEQFVLPIVGQLMFFLPASIIVACKKNNYFAAVFAVLISLLAAFVTITKMQILIVVIFSLMAFTRFSPPILHGSFFRFLKMLSLVLIPIFMISAFNRNNIIRNDAASASKMDYMEKGKVDVRYERTASLESAFLNYLYFSTPWANLEYNVKNNKEVGYGRNSFGQFGKFVGLKVASVHKKNRYIFNTHTFITDYYIDFGYIGAIIASFILGWLIYFCYRRYGLSNAPPFIAFYCLIMNATIMLFFSNHFNNGYLLNGFVLFGGYYLLSGIVRLNSRRSYVRIGD